MRTLLAVLLVSVLARGLAAQTVTTPDSRTPASQTPDSPKVAAQDETKEREATAREAREQREVKEQEELGQALGEVGSSAIDLTRALETHLKKYPDTKQRAAIEKTLAKSAMDTNDNPRIVLYGERVLAATAPGGRNDDVTLLDRLTRALVDSSDPEQLKKALEYARRYESDVVALRTQTPPPQHLTAGQWMDQMDRARARVLALQAHATGNLGDPSAAARLAIKAWEAYPTGEGAREAALWLLKLERTRQAIEFYADAFTLADSRTTPADRAKDRERLGELYAKLVDPEQGLGELILQAYDRTNALLSERHAVLKANDPNIDAVNVSDFVLPAVENAAPALTLASLKGKVLVMDFWATWCVPCRAQQPLIENVKQHFADATDIVFLAIDADDDPSLVAPFVKQQGWTNAGYLEAGMVQKLTINAIPTVLVVDASGQISSRMTGFIPERFEQMLTQRIEDARHNNQ